MYRLFRDQRVGWLSILPLRGVLLGGALFMCGQGGWGVHISFHTEINMLTVLFSLALMIDLFMLTARLTFLYTSSYEHVQYNVSGPYGNYFSV